MTDRYENIRKALASFDACGSHYWRDELARECDPDTIRELLAERDALERDAERYRFIRDDHGSAWEEELDAAIVAANGGGNG